MSFYEYLPHENSYTCFLADHYDLLPYDSMIHINNYIQIHMHLNLSTIDGYIFH